MVVLLHFATTEYYASLKNEEYATRLKNEFRVLLDFQAKCEAPSEKMPSYSNFGNFNTYDSNSTN